MSKCIVAFESWAPMHNNSLGCDQSRIAEKDAGIACGT